MSIPYNSSVDHPHKDPIYTPEPSNSLPPSPKPPQHFIVSSITHSLLSITPMLKNLSSTEVVLLQQSQATQTDYVPPYYPHPVVIAKQVKEHYP